MIKEKEDQIDLTQYEDSEIQYIGVNFLKDLIEVLDKYESFYKSHFYYKILKEVHSFAKRHLKWEESRAA